MAWEIKVLDLGSLEIDGSRTVATRAPGIRVRLPVQGFLLVGPEHVVVVDTGFRHPEILQRIGLQGFAEPGQALDAQLRAHGVRFGDVRYVLHTHLHCLCGDIVYNVAEQLSATGVLEGDPVLSGSTVRTRRSEKAAIKRVLNSPASLLYPGHDRPARIIRGATTELVQT